MISTPVSIKFRDFNDRDLDAVIEIFRSNIPRYFVPDEEDGLREFLSTSVEHYYVAESDADVVASGGIALNADDTVSLCWGMVHRSRLGTGLGKLLTEYRLARSQEMFGAKPMVISTSQHTKGFYEKFGFVLTEEIANGFGPGINICKMRKQS
jgi:predicted GNAT family N-acyltransferase